MLPKERCLITGVELNENNRIEHTILKSLGGRITSRSVTSSLFNQNCGENVDCKLADKYKTILSRLVPVTIESANPGQVKLYDSEGKHKLTTKDGTTFLAKSVIERNDSGEPKNAMASTIEQAQQLANQLRSTITDSQIVPLPNSGSERYRFRASRADIAIAIIKCIVLTLDVMLRRKGLYNFIRSDECKEVRELLNLFIMERKKSEVIHILNAVFMGLQIDCEQEMEKILSKAKCKETKFNHLIIISGNPATRTLDVLWKILGIETYGVRLSNNWRGEAFTYVIQNSILKNSPEPDLFVIENYSTVLCKKNRATKSDETNTNELYRMAIIEAFTYVENHADEYVKNEFLNIANIMTGNRTAKDIIIKHLSEIYKEEDILSVLDSIQKNGSAVSCLQSDIDMTLDNCETWSKILKVYRLILSKLTFSNINPNFYTSIEINII